VRARLGAGQPEEIAKLAARMGSRMSAAELGEAMAEMDADGSGEIDFDEFSAWCRRRRPNTPPQHPHPHPHPPTFHDFFDTRFFS
jgi:hypothetical protein